MARLRGGLFRAVTATLLFACNALTGAGDLSIEPGTTERPAPIADAAAESTPNVAPEAGVDPDASSGLDGGTTPECDPAKPFGGIAPIATLNSLAEDDGARLTADELTIVFSSTRAPSVGGYDLWSSTRASRSLPWPSPSPIAGVNTNANERFPAIRSDGLVLYAKYDGPGGSGAGDVYFATRGPAGAFAALAPVAGMNAASDDGNPFVSPDGTSLWFGTTRSGGTDIYRASLTAPGVATAVAPESGDINSNANDTSAAVSADGRTMFFASARGGGPAGTRDIYVARRAQANGPFGAASPVTELNSSADDLPTWISGDGCRIYFSSDRNGHSEIFYGERSK
ncbi:MAG: PD40 domain-containing protein [Deltaproteobacteria bacterium]|nr:PD40 domain-containing protein [Deltaproteobacteria bacterium]